MRVPTTETSESRRSHPTAARRSGIVHMAPMPMPVEGQATSASRRSKLQLQCSDGTLFDVTHEEAMMSSTLWMLLQDVMDRHGKTTARQHTIPIFDVPSASVELALFYCRCQYKFQVEGLDNAMHDWEDRFYNLDSKTLCDLAKVASNLDIQPLVDVTCRSIAQIMSATEAAHEIRQKFGLEDAPGSVECSCELRSGMAGFDFDMFNSLDHDLSTDEYELVEFDQPSVDELVNFINGDTTHPSSSNSRSKNCTVHGGLGEVDGDSQSAAAAKKKKKKKRKKKGCVSKQQHGHDGDGLDDDEDSDPTPEPRVQGTLTPEELEEKMRLASQNPSAVFQESQFEDDEDDELDEQLESFRLALESAHLDSKPARARPRLEFAPQDVFRKAVVDAHRQSTRVSASIS